MKILLKNIEKENYKGDLKNYLKEGGYQALEKALKMSSEKIIKEVKSSRLLGRGGAGFPCGLKWEFVYKEKGRPKYVVCNADEGEPGTFKDRLILEKDPHLLLEAMAVCARAISSNEGLIYIRGEYVEGYRSLKKAIKEAEKNNFLGKNILGSNFSFKIALYRGAGAYVCGEETALLDSLEGKKGQSRIKPPFPTFVGFKNKPTVLNNVETLANIPAIILGGGEWFSKMGSSASPGTKLYCLSGDVKKPGVYELLTNITLKELIYSCGGGPDGKIKAILPGGVSSCFLGEKDLDVIMDYKSIQEKGSMLGSGAVIVINNTRCLVDVAKRCAEFFAYEACGKCAPCREGTKRAKELLTNITIGKGEPGDVELLKELQEILYDTSRCGLGQSAISAIRSALEKFPDEFERHILKKKCPLGVCRT
ncbi:MAG: NADH-quinone oxidoreductase subunit NuoF [Candidatus Omnitrophota bacterium]|nr:NADH-quinone oxidoreductase subunit NuoF [Candidatus Omnitrophota bacterium]